ncbi:SDR family oxidoreductase [Nakamurella flavida]|uniref:SDR family oxidoreductase n=1 Tax=Nakamurella flavida TaxID=363630 RepID=A0A939C1U8_9ACTN|nr:SDR family NAD(P)-dependent oxidoreductase [Nakamurella flavida]MBM9478063.1 SDR family oxidoreductase [Nakamurella flavida]MDP9778220.1 NAD(P)-dependent dehydrogenase (short-subunit alcohol dehydrogenase family) [Nakamurella flavida]
MSSILVVGGSTGIGAAAVRAFRDRGDTVTLADRNEVDGRAVVGERRAGAAHFLPADVGDASSLGPLVAAAADLGGGLDTVFYNAGVLHAFPLGEWTAEAFDRSVAVNLRGPFLLTQAAAPHLRASTCGRVILTSSTGALRGHAGMAPYHATKAGLLGLVRALADELGPHGVTVNAVLPGWVDTPFNDAFWSHQDDPPAALADLVGRIPLRHQASADEITGLLTFLASAASGYITGQALVIDGGYTAV